MSLLLLVTWVKNSKFTTEPKFLNGIPIERCWFSLHSRDHELSQFKVLVCNINNTKIILRQPRSQVSLLLGTGRREPWEWGWSCRWAVQSLSPEHFHFWRCVTHYLDVTVPNSRDRPALSLFSPWKWILKRCLSQFPTNGSCQRVMKRFINFFHMWLFFFSPRMLDYYWPSNRNFMKWQASCYVTPNLHRDWQIADQNISKSRNAVDWLISSWPELSPLP